MHRTWRERIGGHAADGPEPEFEPSADSTLIAFAQLFIDSELLALDANKHLRTDALSPIYDCETESRHRSDSAPESFFAIWDPVWAGTDPVTGFRSGQDSAAFGSTPTVAMPQDERTAALLLLVTTRFVHLSAQRDGASVLVRGAVDAGDDGFRFVELVPDAVPAVASLPENSA
jgi:hypothetical protein